jgi:hypothetical protein
LSIYLLTFFAQGASKTPDGFEIRNPTCQLRSAFDLTIIMYSDVWSLVDMVSAASNCDSGTVYQNKVDYSYIAWFPTAVSKT